MERENHFLILQRSLSSDGCWRNVYLESWKKIMEVTCTKDENSISSLINSMLVSNEKKTIGLQLLDLYLEKATIGNIEKNINLWINIFFKPSSHLRIEMLESNISLIYKILGKIALRSRESPSVERSFIVSYLPKIYFSLATVPRNQLLTALRCCEICLKLFPQDTSSYKQNIEQFLKEQICCLNNDISIYVGKCFHLLQSVRDKTGRNIKDQWSTYMHLLLNSAHSLLNTLYSKYSNNSTYIKESSESLMILIDDKLCKDVVKKFGQLYIQFRNLINYLIIASRDPFPVKKPLMIQKILNLIIKGCRVTNVMLLDHNTESIVLEPIVPKIHADLIRLLNVLIVTVNFNIRPYSSLIVKILINTLTWTSDLKTKDYQLVGFLRNKTYETLSLWCDMMTTGSRIELVIIELLKEIFLDLNITQNRSVLIPKLSIQNKPELEKKQKYQFQLNQAGTNNKKVWNYIEHSLESKTDNQCNPVIVSNCLYSILQSSFNLIDSSAIKMIYLNILKLCARLFQPKTTKQWNNKFYVNIYNTLYFLISIPDLYNSQYKNLLCKLLGSAALYSRSNQLENIFSDHSLENIIHPIKDGLLYSHKIDNLSEIFSTEKIPSTSLNCNISNELQENYIFNVENNKISTEMNDDKNNRSATLINKKLDNYAENNSSNCNLNNFLKNTDDDNNVKNVYQNNEIIDIVSMKESKKHCNAIEKTMFLSKNELEKNIKISKIINQSETTTSSIKILSQSETDFIKPDDLEILTDITNEFVDELIE